MFQALPKATPKILSTLPGQSKTLTTANLSPQQQRIVLQSFKQPASTGSPASQTTTRLIRTTPVTATATATASASTTSSGTATGAQGGQIITLDHLLHKSTPGKLLTTGSNIIQLATSTGTGNVISLTPSGQSQQQQLQQPQQTQPQQQQQQVHSASAQVSAAAKQLRATARIVTASNTTMVPKIIGKTTVVPGKPLLLHAKTLKLGTGNAVVTSQATVATTAPTTLNTGGMKTTAQNIVIGGQTMKLHGAVC